MLAGSWPRFPGHCLMAQGDWGPRGAPCPDPDSGRNDLGLGAGAAQLGRGPWALSQPACIKHQASSIKHQAPSIKYQAAGIEHQASSIKHQASTIKPQAAGINNQAMNCFRWIRLLGSHCPTKHICKYRIVSKNTDELFKPID